MAGRCRKTETVKQASRRDLEEEAAFVRREVTLENVPEPADDAMSIVKPAVVLRVSPDNISIINSVPSTCRSEPNTA